MVKNNEGNETPGVEGRQPVHARVLPSFLVEQLSRPFSTWLGDIEPIELVRWTKSGLPPNKVAGNIRLDTLGRLRQRHPALWERPTGIRLKPEWARWLSNLDAASIQKVIEAYDGRAFESLTFLEIKSVVAKPFAHVIGLLAAIEAVDWVAPAGVLRRRHGWDLLRKFDDPSMVKLTDELRELSERALELLWVAGIKGNDLRIQAPGGTAPAQWIREQLEGRQVSVHLDSIVRGILDAEDMSYADEVRSLAVAALQRCARAPSLDKEVRWVAMFTGRYVAPVEAPTLQEVGKRFEVTRERVRQICEAILEELRSQSTVMPALDRVMRMAARAVPCSVEDADKQLAKQLGDGAGVCSAMELATDMGFEVPVRLGRVKVRVLGKYEDAPLLESANCAGKWPQAVLRYAAKECVTLGCTSVIRMAGALSLHEGVAPGQEALEAVFRQAAGFRWLDEDNGWFSIGDTTTSGAATRLRKILSVANEPVSVDEVAEAFACDTRWFRSGDERALSIPPTHVIQAMAASWPWVKSVQYTRFVAAEKIPYAGTLSEVEQRILALIEENNGAAAAWQLYEGVMATRQVTKMAVALVLATSAILNRFEHGLYTLRGRRLKADALLQARAALARRYSGATPVYGDDVFRVRVTEAALRNEQYAVPTRMKDRLAGRCVDISGTPHQAKITQSGSMKGLNQCFESLRVGDELVVCIDGGGISVSRMATPAELEPSLGYGRVAVDDDVGPLAAGAAERADRTNPDEFAQ